MPETLWQIYAQHQKDYFADSRTRSSGLDVELSGRHHNGGEFPIHVSMSSIDTGDVLLVIAGGGNVATQRRAVRNAGLVEAIVEYSEDAIIGATLDGTITSWNPAAEKMYGYSASEIIGRSGQLLMPKDRTEEMRELLVGLKTGHHVEHLETTRVRKDGTVVPVSVSIAPIYDENGTIVGVSAAYRDVTQQRQAFEAAEHLAAIVQFSGEAIFSRTIEGIITSWNPAAERMYGYSSEEIVGKPIALLIPEDRTGEIEATLAKISAGQTVEHLETIRVRRDGTAFPVSLTVSPINAPDGSVVGASVISRDLTEQKRALETSQRLASIVEYSQDAMMSGSLDGEVMSWNPAAERLFGYSSEDIVGKPGSLLLPKDRAGEIRAVLERVTAGEHVKEFETMRVRKDGTVFPISLTASPTRDADGMITGASVIYRDLTEQKRAEQAVEQERDRLRATMDSLMDPHVLFEAVRDERGQIVDFRFADANPAACAYDGIAYQDLVGSRMLEHFPGVVGAGLLKQYAHIVETGQALRLDDAIYPMETMGGKDRHLDISAARVGDGLSFTWRDVSERHEAFLYGRRMAAVVEQTHDAIIGVSFPDPFVTSWNPAAERMYGYTPEEVIGKTVLILTPKDQLEKATGLITQLLDGEPMVNFETVRVRKDGTEVQVSMSSSPIRDANGVTVGVSTIHRDITKEKAAREEARVLGIALKTSNDSLRDFVAVASHDLRSPLVTIAGFTKILADNWATLSDEARLKQLSAIQRGVDRLSRLTDDLLSSAKVEGEAEQARPVPIRLATALASYLEANSEGRGTIAVTCPPELVAVVDPSHLTRILDNYLTNAFKYGEPPICIEAERVGDFVELRVRDHGPGVPPELAPRLFTKFDRGDTKAARMTHGTGLGLSIVKALAGVNHGDVRYQEDEPTGGCFVVRLPATAP